LVQRLAAHLPGHRSEIVKHLRWFGIPGIPVFARIDLFYAFSNRAEIRNFHKQLQTLGYEVAFGAAPD
jgi:hypothetical protein